MSQNTPKVHAALVIACIALALSMYAVVRGPSEATAGANACVDHEARAQTQGLRRALADRDALVARLARAVNAPGTGSAAGEPSHGRAAPPDPGPRRFTHFETSNPAVSVTQKDDGSYDIRTTDPSLAGSVMQITAVGESGEEEKLMIRIPQ
jgi:hypothetical protein